MLSIEQILCNDHRASDSFDVDKSNASSDIGPFRLFLFCIYRLLSSFIRVSTYLCYLLCRVNCHS